MIDRVHDATSCHSSCITSRQTAVHPSGDPLYYNSGAQTTPDHSIPSTPTTGTHSTLAGKT